MTRLTKAVDALVEFQDNASKNKHHESSTLHRLLHEIVLARIEQIGTSRKAARGEREQKGNNNAEVKE